jgi:hypothetical protein
MFGVLLLAKYFVVVVVTFEFDLVVVEPRVGPDRGKGSRGQ